MKRNILIILITLIVAALLFYVMVPPINLTSPLFWTYLLFIYLIFLILYVIFNANYIIFKNTIRFGRNNLNKNNNIIFYSMGIVFIIYILIFLVNFCVSPVFNAKSYSKRINVDTTHDFITDIKEVDFSKTPLVDKDSSQKLGDRKVGEFTAWVSQFYVSDLYTQINYNNEIVRVTPLEYDGIIKYFSNRKDGIKGYISVNSVSGDANLVTLNEGMKYMPSAYFNEDLIRKLRFTYPTAIFDEANFEIDNEGNPYWIIPTIKYSGIGMKKEINGAVILDPISGESKRYDVKDIPTWVDHIYSADLIIEQIDNWGEYQSGFLNSLFGQKNVINTTDGYNYLVMDDDVYLYTGITSVSSDESNLGFVLVNLRTKETNYYLVPGAEEYSAMASAEGLVQEKDYEASFPLLINLNNKPTYLLSLKDDAGLVKMYAFIDVQNYQKVIVSDVSLGIEAAKEKYLKENNIVDENNLKTKEITIKSITNAVIDGNTNYYITDTSDNKYFVDINVNKNILPFLKQNDKINISYLENKISQIISLELK